MRNQAPAATERSKDEISPGFLTHKAGMIPSHLAFAVNSGSAYSRAVGPGLVRLSPSETVTRVVDLRRHMRRIIVEAMSSDGIPIEATITVIFHVKHDSQLPEDDFPYPYDHEAIFSINNLESIKSDQEIIAWPERIERTAYNLFVDELARYSLDQLFQGSESIVPSLSRVRARLQRRLSKEFDNYGVSITDVLLSKIELPEDVVDQRINLWEANWQSSVEVEEVRELTAPESVVEEVSIEAHAAVIQNILDDFEAVRDQGGAELADAILISVSEAMKTVASDDQALSTLPPDTSVRLRRVFDPGRLLDEKDD
jgi:regulator of protease activity HflC (stomatin/prohibitin superfamily)